MQIICRTKDTTKQLPEFVLVLFMLITRPIVEYREITLLNLNLANVILVNSLMHFILNYLVTNYGRKKKEVKTKKERKKVLAANFHIHWAIDYTISNNIQAILDSLTSLSLAKFHYHSFQLGHDGCWCYYCHLQHMMLKTIMDRGHKYLNGALALEKFEETDPPYPFY